MKAFLETGTRTKVSVCLPVRNGARYLAQAIDSVLDQSCTDFELLIADDASTDDSISIITRYAKKDSRIIWWQNPKRLGLFANYNACMERASGEFIKPFAQDDMLYSNILEQMLGVLANQPEISLVGCNRRFVGETDSPLDVLSNYTQAASYIAEDVVVTGKDVLLASLFPVRNFIGEPVCVMFRRDAMDTGFDTTFWQTGDLEYWLRLLLRGNYYHISDELCNFRIHKEGSTAVNSEQLLHLTDAIRFGIKFQNVFPRLGKSDEEFFRLAVAEAVYSVQHFLNTGALDVKGLRDFHDFGNESPLTDMVVYRELLIRAISLSKKDSLQSLDHEHEYAFIVEAESRLRRVLNSWSWVSTRPLREFNRLYRMCKGTIEGKCEPNADNNQLKGQTYLELLREEYSKVLQSRSWKLTKLFR